MTKYYFVCPAKKLKVAVGSGDESKIRIIWSGNETVMRSLVAFCQKVEKSEILLVKEGDDLLSDSQEIIDQEPSSGHPNASWARSRFDT